MNPAQRGQQSREGSGGNDRRLVAIPILAQARYYRGIPCIAAV
jgi:hypothetical protein